MSEKTLQKYYFRRFHRFDIYIYFTFEKNKYTETVGKKCLFNERQFGISQTQHVLLFKIHFKQS